MDSTGVPHKINRHVYKAVNHLGLDGSNFSNIYQYVRVCTRNLKPVPHLKQTIRRSLNNLQATGIVKMDFKHRYKLKTKYPLTHKDNNNKVGETTNSNDNLSPQARKHKRQQIDSDDDENYTDEIDNVPKRFKATTKNISRTRMQVKKLPKHRQHDLRNRKIRSCSKVKQPAERSKANVIYKKVNTARSDGIINTEPGSNDKDFNNNECDTRQSKEVCYDSRTEDDVKSEKTKIIDTDVKKIDSVLSKNATSYQSNDFEDVANGPDEQTTDIIDSTTNNTNAVHNNEPPDADEDTNPNTLNSMRRYNYNYLN